jgi:hypothetical protein
MADSEGVLVVAVALPHGSYGLGQAMNGTVMQKHSGSSVIMRCSPKATLSAITGIRSLAEAGRDRKTLFSAGSWGIWCARNQRESGIPRKTSFS